MKKLLLIATIAFSAFTASAQTEKGNIVLGGTAQFTTSKSEGADESEDEFTITPVIGYFVSNNISIGTGIGYTQSKNEDLKIGAFVVAPFGRVYKNLGSEQFKFFGELSVPLAFGTVKDTESGTKLGTSTTVGVSLAPGFAFFPTKKFGIELGFNGISYLNTTAKPEVGSKSTNDTFSIGADFFSPQIGLQFYF